MSVELRSPAGGLVRRVNSGLERGRAARLLRPPRRLAPGRYEIVVDAARGERVRRPLRVR